MTLFSLQDKAHRYLHREANEALSEESELNREFGGVDGYEAQLADAFRTMWRTYPDQQTIERAYKLLKVLGILRSRRIISPRTKQSIVLHFAKTRGWRGNWESMMSRARRAQLKTLRMRPRREQAGSRTKRAGLREWIRFMHAVAPYDDDRFAVARYLCRLRAERLDEADDQVDRVRDLLAVPYKQLGALVGVSGEMARRNLKEAVEILSTRVNRPPRSQSKTLRPQDTRGVGSRVPKAERKLAWSPRRPRRSKASTLREV